MVLKLNNYVAGTLYNNTATATQAGATPNPRTASAAIMTGAPAISVSASENAASLLRGQNITYTLSYDVNGYSLQNFQPFDNIPVGTYSASAPPGWRLIPFTNGDPGTWTVKDPCNSGGSYLEAGAQPSDYPGLLLDDGIDGNNADAFCTGMIISDFYIDDASYSGADAQITIRSNGLSGGAGRQIGVVASIDNAPAYLYLPGGLLYGYAAFRIRR